MQQLIAELVQIENASLVVRNASGAFADTRAGLEEMAQNISLLSAEVQSAHWVTAAASANHTSQLEARAAAQREVELLSNFTNETARVADYARLLLNSSESVVDAYAQEVSEQLVTVKAANKTLARLETRHDNAEVAARDARYRVEAVAEEGLQLVANALHRIREPLQSEPLRSASPPTLRPMVIAQMMMGAVAVVHHFF